MASGDLIPRIYGNFRGVDFRGDEINLVRSPDSLNVWKDYRETESIRTRPGTDLLMSFNEPVYGVFFYKPADTEMMLVHSGTKLYKVVGGNKTEIYTGLKRARSEAFIFNNRWYFKDGANYLQYDGATIEDVQGYVPTTSINRKPGGSGNVASGGAILEDVNMLSTCRINTFIGDGESKEFYVDVPYFLGVNPNLSYEERGEFISKNYEVVINDVVVYPTSTSSNPEYTVTPSPGDGKFTINPAPPKPLTEGQANVKIKFPKSDDRRKITECTLLQVFDNRVFFSGNPEYPNMIWHCSLNDPTYCSDLDYYNEGLDVAEVKGMVAGNNALWVFKEPSQANTTVFYHTPTIDSEYGKIYPNRHSSISTGCIGKAINFNDDIIFFSDRGMEGISGDVTAEQVIAHRSTLVDRKLVAEQHYKDMILEEWEGYLLAFCMHTEYVPMPGMPGFTMPVLSTRVYLADSRAMFTNENHVEYEWFYWEFDEAITCTKVNKGVLYLGTTNGVYTLTDNECAVESWWVTPKDKFMYPQHLKTTNKKGCVVEATTGTAPEYKGDISVYARTEKTDFELVGKYENIKDYFVCRIKRKKFKDIQLKFHSKTRFALETATLECFIGGYNKR